MPDEQTVKSAATPPMLMTEECGCREVDDFPCGWCRYLARRVLEAAEAVGWDAPHREYEASDVAEYGRALKAAIDRELEGAGGRG